MHFFFNQLLIEGLYEVVTEYRKKVSIAWHSSSSIAFSRLQRIHMPDFVETSFEAVVFQKLSDFSSLKCWILKSQGNKFKLPWVLISFLPVKFLLTWELRSDHNLWARSLALIGVNKGTFLSFVYSFSTDWFQQKNIYIFLTSFFFNGYCQKSYLWFPVNFNLLKQ